MNDRLVTLGLAVAAFAAFYALLGPKSQVEDDPVTRPLTTEAGPNGYLGIWNWLGVQDVEVESFRDRFDLLESDTTRSPSGNLLITTMPHRLPVREREADALDLWIRRGNTLLVLAALTDTPEWSMGSQYDAALARNLTRLTGLQIYSEVDAETTSGAVPADEIQQSGTPALNERLAEPKRMRLVASGNHPLLQGVESLVLESEYPASEWNAIPQNGTALVLARTEGNAVPSLWLLQSGSGRIIVSAAGSVLTNKVVGDADNGRMLANIVAWSLGEQGRVLFDDAHQGLVAFYDPDAFFGDARLHRTLGWIVFLWLVFVLGAQRLRPRQATWTAPDVTGFVVATGSFFSRVLRPAEAGRRLFENYFNVVRRRLGFTQDGQPLWEWLETQGTVAPAEVDELRRLHERVQGSRRVDLARIHNLLNSTLERMK